MSVEKDNRGLRVLNVFDGSPAAGRRHPQAGPDPVGQRPLDRRAQQRPRHRPHQGPGRDEGRARGVHAGRVATRAPCSVERERIDVPVATGRVVERDGHKHRRRAAAQLQHGRARRAAPPGRQGARRRAPQAIVLDLRGNGGGLLDEAVLVSSIFIEDGKIVSVRGRARPERTDDAAGRRDRPEDPGRRAGRRRQRERLRDRHRRAARPRPRDGGRHEHVRQGPGAGGRAALERRRTSTSPWRTTTCPAARRSPRAASSRR